MKTRSYETRTFMFRFQMVFDKMTAICPDFRSHLKSGPIATQPIFDHCKSRLVWISDPHCIYISTKSIRYWLFRWKPICILWWPNSLVHWGPSVLISPCLLCFVHSTFYGQSQHLLGSIKGGNTKPNFKFKKPAVVEQRYLNDKVFWYSGRRHVCGI